MPWAETALDAGWRLDGPGADGLPAEVPGTVAGAFRAAGHPAPEDLDEHAWTFTCAFATPTATAPAVLHLDGLATLSTVELNGVEVLRSESAWATHTVDVTQGLRPAGDENALVLRFAPLGPEVRRPRKPRARWRTKLVANGLRWHRTMLLGRAPGIAPGPALVGPWRPVRLQLRDGLGVTDLGLRARLDDGAGVLTVHADVVGGPATRVDVLLDGPSGGCRAHLDAHGVATLRVPAVERWWPHTHGDPVLHGVRLEADGCVLAERRVGFRTIVAGATAGHDIERDGLDLHVNGVRTWARGAVWSPPDIVGMAPPERELRATLQAARDAGMNLVRVVGTAAYEAPEFHALCDELGLLVWQDVMCANLDYPLADVSFRAAMEAELAALVARLAGSASTAVLCGGSEVGQQAAMLGLDSAPAREGVGYGLLPAAVAAAGCDAVVVPDAPSGAARPFRPDTGVANYFGVGGYQRPLSDVRRSAVRFASECLAFANVPDERVVAAAGVDGGVPRDAGAEWDFADVRDHYLAERFGVDPAALRAQDAERYLELSRAVSGEIMAEVMGEWRRAASPCGGALVLWLRDLVPGSGWGILDHRGAPKAAFHHLRRALAPVTVWSTDEGLNGVALHVANDGPGVLEAELRVELFAGDRSVGRGAVPITVWTHSTVEHDVETVLGRWVDAAYAYRFGPPAHDVVVATLVRHDVTLASTCRFPAGRPLEPRPAPELGARAWIEGGAAPRVSVESRSLLYGVRVHLPGWRPEDDAFTVAPGERRTIALTPEGAHTDLPAGELTALNLEGRLTVGPPA